MEIEVYRGSKEEEKKEKEYGKYDKYEIEGAVRTLMEAEEIKNNKEKMKYVQMCLNKKKKVINSIADLRAKHQEISKDEY